MKSVKIMIAAIAILLAINVSAQEKEDVAVLQNRIDSLEQRINQKEAAQASKEREKRVWGKQKGFAISYLNQTLKSPDGIILNESNNSTEMKSQYGFGLEPWSKTWFVTRPIGGVFRVGVDAGVGIEFFKYDNKLEQFGDLDDEEYDVPEFLEEVYQLDASLKVGPSFTIAPFANSDNNNLCMLRARLYYHLSPSVAVLKTDFTEFEDGNEDEEYGYDYDSDSDSQVKSTFALYHRIGLCLEWKMLGLGIEYKCGSAKYNVDNVQLGDKLKLNTSAVSFFLSLRF